MDDENASLRLCVDWFSFAKNQTKFILISYNASWHTAIGFKSLMKTNYKIVKRLFCLNYILQKYHRSVSNVPYAAIASTPRARSTPASLTYRILFPVFFFINKSFIYKKFIFMANHLTEYYL